LNEKTLAAKEVAKEPPIQSFAALLKRSEDTATLNQIREVIKMQKRRGSKRAIVKKVTALNLFADQATQIQAIMEATGAQEVAPLMRELLDEALAARRRKSVHKAEAEPPPRAQDVGETLQTIQTLLLKLIRQGETGLRAGGISLVLLQEVLGVTTRGTNIAWNRLEVPALSEGGMTAKEIEDRLGAETNEAKDFAYGVADEIRKQQDRKASSNGHGHKAPELPFESS